MSDGLFKKTVATVSACLLLAASTTAYAARRKLAAPVPRPGIYQLVETRRGRRACRGVVIRPGDSRFKKRVEENQIEISEAKHGHDLKDIMRWRISGDGRQIVIDFKPGAGDFGSGNAVEVTIDGSAFAGPGRGGENRFTWSITTDPL